MEENKVKLYKKWWFLVCMIVVLIIGIVLSIILIVKNNTKNIDNISLQMQNIYKDSTLYSSINNTLILELNHFDTEKNAIEYRNIISLIKNNLNKGLKKYKKLIILSYIDNKENNQGQYMLLTTVYSLPDFMEKESKNYIIFDNYKELYNNYMNLYNSYGETMKDYTNLFMSIGR